MRRRTFLAASSAALVWPAPSFAADSKPLPRVAAINSIYRLRSHAYHIAGRFIHGYRIKGQHHQPPFKLVRMYNDQTPVDDLGREVCQKHGIELCPTVAEALGGRDKLDVDAVLLIVEHGDYPENSWGQIEYPRFELFQQVTDVFRRVGRAVPVFVDKHLSYDRVKASIMMQTAQQLKFGLMAGSSLPVTWRQPDILPELGTPFREGLVCFGFDRATSEIYLFHALEALQCMLERRRGGETGVKWVRSFKGEAVWKAGDEGLWSWSLLDAALKRNPSRNYGQVREQVRNPEAIVVEYTDGTRGAALNLVEAVSDLTFAGRIEGREEPLSTWFVLPAPPGARFFDPLTWNIEQFFTTGKSPYPVERTLLTSTILDIGMHGLYAKQGQASIGDNLLNVRYQAPADDGHFRGPFVDA